MEQHPGERLWSSTRGASSKVCLVRYKLIWSVSWQINNNNKRSNPFSSHDEVEVGYFRIRNDRFTYVLFAIECTAKILPIIQTAMQKFRTKLFLNNKALHETMNTTVSPGEWSPKEGRSLFQELFAINFICFVFDEKY